MHISRIGLLVVLAIVGIYMLYRRGEVLERFFNVLPTRMIDPQFVANAQRPAYFDAGTNQSYEEIGRGGGVDLNCNAVETRTILHWIRWNDPDVLNQYLYRFDPSANIDNPDDAPRILKSLLRNLPTQHKYVPILSNCFPTTVRV